MPLFFRYGLTFYINNKYWIQLQWNPRLTKRSGNGLVYFYRKIFKTDIFNICLLGLYISASYVNQWCDLPSVERGTQS